MIAAAQDCLPVCKKGKNVNKSHDIHDVHVCVGCSSNLPPPTSLACQWPLISTQILHLFVMEPNNEYKNFVGYEKNSN